MEIIHTTSDGDVAVIKNVEDGESLNFNFENADEAEQFANDLRALFARYPNAD